VTQKLQRKEDALLVLSRHPQITNQKLTYLARMRQFATISWEEGTFFDALTPLSTGHHLVAFEDEEKCIKGFCTQRQLYAQIADQIMSFAGGLTMESLTKFISSPARSVMGTKSAFEAFKELSSHNFGSLAVVDTSGHLVASTSGRDVKQWLMQDDVETMTIQDLMSRLQENSQRSQPLTTALLEQDLTESLRDLKVDENERIWVLHPDGTLHGVFSLSDFFRVFLPQGEN